MLYDLRKVGTKASLRKKTSMWLWGEVDRALTSAAVRHREIEGREAQSLALRVDMIRRLLKHKVLIKAHSLLVVIG